jgi:hypothetical protein
MAAACLKGGLIKLAYIVYARVDKQIGTFLTRGDVTGLGAFIPADSHGIDPKPVGVGRRVIDFSGSDFKAEGLLERGGFVHGTYETGQTRNTFDPHPES